VAAPRQSSRVAIRVTIFCRSGSCGIANWLGCLKASGSTLRYTQRWREIDSTFGCASSNLRL
jgi:hypothetical protein